MSLKYDFNSDSLNELINIKYIGIQYKRVYFDQKVYV